MHIVILRGVSGSGKSTLAKTYASHYVVSADTYFMREGRYEFDPRKLPDAHGECLLTFIGLVQQGHNVVVDNTNCSVAEIAPYAAIALAYKADLEIVTLSVKWETAFSRNVHGVPEATVMKMAMALEKGTLDMPPWWPHKLLSV